MLIGCKNSSDLQKAYQLTLDLPELQQYYHINEAPNRVPLIVVKNEFMNSKFKLKKFDKPVILLTKEKIRQKKIVTYFKFTDVKQKGNSLIIKFRYPVEGLAGKVIFKKTGNNWKIIDHFIAEK